MVFVQSLRGLSHTKLEDTKTEHLELVGSGARPLASKTLAWLAPAQSLRVSATTGLREHADPVDLDLDHVPGAIATGGSR